MVNLCRSVCSLVTTGAWDVGIVTWFMGFCELDLKPRRQHGLKVLRGSRLARATLAQVRVQLSHHI